ncbi:MAG: glycosyltransferase family 2 protein [Fibrobacteria bacterium]|nr:glycosyltransferase family 2 protein [Fibrobacteria bacterium]
MNSLKKPHLTILIATWNRTELLRKRSLPSLRKQSFAPSRVILVDNSEKKFHIQNQQIFEKCIPSEWNPVYIKNSCHQGNAFSWNMGLEWIRNNTPETWVAILDDDDLWEPNHLELCINAVETNLDCVISGIQTVLDGTLLKPKNIDQFTVSDFLSGNPGWEGSNTFLRYTAFEEVGFFDEDLSCTHDRDLAIRLLSNSKFKYKIVPKITVKHFIETNRLSLTISPKKKVGMIQFWNKHNSKMTTLNKEAFLKRAKDLFNLDKELFEEYVISEI